jgi:hypothetical protein
MPRSIAKECLRFTGLFEAELLTELLLRYWQHPRADDGGFRSALLESASEALRASVGGERLFEDLDPTNVNFVAAVWYAESVSVEEPNGRSVSEQKLRQNWLDTILRALPSCFCNPELLD